MNRKQFITTLLTLLALLLSVGGATGQGPGPEEEISPQGNVSTATTVNSSISYQGMLKEGGNPVTGSRDMTFHLYSDSSCTTQVGSDIIKNGVTVTDGLFSVELDVTHSHFDGQGLWLEVDVDGTQISCREILPVPYALSLRPGAFVIGEQTDWNAIYAKNAATTGCSYGLRGISCSSDGRGISGENTATSGTACGVYGKSTSTSGRGVHGYANATNGITYGVYGETNSSTDLASGVYGKSTQGATHGIHGETSSNANNAAGVFGKASATSGLTYGLYGEINSSTTDSSAVYGFANGGGDIKSIMGRLDSCNGGVAVAGFSTCSRHAGWFETDDWESVKIKNNSSEAYALWVDNANSNGYLIGASNDTDTELWLDGLGNLYIDGSLHQNQGDYADMLPAVAGLEPGDVLVIGLDGNLTRSTQANQTAIAGIYSTDPGIVGRPYRSFYDEDDPTNTSGWASEPFQMLTSEVSNPPNASENNPADMLAELDEGFVPLALAGVVPVKVSAENGPIQPGDLLTTASLPGHAMKASPVDLGGVTIYRPGTIIGKALEPLAESTGVIQILVILQ
ncbi:MAG: hypothetical protein SWK90_17555 [Chloroflexota bacterium]|nr:hypothetical protein [Chloroflexota bacterium]